MNPSSVRTFLTVCLGAVTFLLAGNVASARQASEELLGTLPGDRQSEAKGVSADGTVVVGNTPVFNSKVFRWTEDAGMEGLGYLGQGNRALVSAVSADGSTVIGTTTEIPGGALFPFRWTRATGMQDLRVFLGSGSGEALTVSADGTVISGILYLGNGERKAYRWSESDGIRLLEHPQGFSSPWITAMSPDGKTIVGSGYDNNGSNYAAYRYTQDGGTQPLGFLPGATRSEALAVSADGSVVAGLSSTPNQTSAFVWTEGEGMDKLELLPGALAVENVWLTADGSTLFGSVWFGRPDFTNIYEPFYWTEAEGVVGLGLPQDMVWANGVGISSDGSVLVAQAGTLGDFWGKLHIWTREAGWELIGTEYLRAGANAISGDGRVIVGYVDRVVDNAPSTRLAARWVLDSGSNQYVLTVMGDGEDADPDDGLCDVDLTQEGEQCTLRAAIALANALPAGEPAPRIVVDVDAAGIPTLNLTSPLPKITRPVVIDGTATPGKYLEINGQNAGLLADGLHIEADSVTVRGLVINRFSGNGIRITGGRGHVLKNNRIGYSADGQTLSVNGSGGIRVEGGARNVTIGAGPGDKIEEANHIGGGLIVAGDETWAVKIYRNTFGNPQTYLSGVDLRPLVDIGEDGPTCGVWEGQAEGANWSMTPPRVTALPTAPGGGAIEGRTRAGAIVVAYRVGSAGTGNGRYWAAEAEPVGIGVADASGAFSILPTSALSAGDQISLTATDVVGNTSELSQLRRPVIFLPGIGGTWLKSLDGTRNWLPLGFTSDEKNLRMSRLTMAEDGTTSLSPILADEVIEDILGLREVYGHIHNHLEVNGFPGHPFNENRATLDQYRFPNDWRLSVDAHANDLRTLINVLTEHSGKQGEAARSCQVDVIAHSNGGMIASTYLLRDASHARDRVNRFITSGTPYLGSTQAMAAHTKGYVFGVDETPLGLGWDVAWGNMMTMVRNVAGAYGLMPSRAYYDAFDWETPSHEHGYAVTDLYNEPVVGYEATLDFMTRSKVNEDNIPYGLARNATVWRQQQERVHDVMNDWSTYDGPPQIFRHVGLTVGATATGWFMGPGREYLTTTQTSRSEPGDTDRHRAYRERVLPIMGLGDHTVPLVSATLGRNTLVGKLDLSGVDESPWIEEFEYYACAHGKLTEPACRPFGSEGPESLDRLVEILRSGHQVVPGAPASKAPAVATSLEGPQSEVIYVMGNAPVAVVVTDSEGRKTGPTDPALPGAIEYGIEEVAYQATSLGAVITTPIDRAYTIEVTSRDPQAAVTLVRQRAGLESLTQILYPNQSLPEGGKLTFALADGGTAEQAAWSLDANGDGTPESEIAPAGVLPGTSAMPAVPFPQPSVFEVEVPVNAMPATYTLKIPDTGTDGWTWTLAGDAPWLELSSTSGAAPASIDLTLGEEGLEQGSQSTKLTLTLTNGSFFTEMEIPVTLVIGVAVSAEAGLPDLPTSLSLGAPYPNPTTGPAMVPFNLPDAAQVRIEVFDLLGRPVMRLEDGQRPAGRHEVAFEPATLPGGVYLVRMTAGNQVLTRRLSVVR